MSAYPRSVLRFVLDDPDYGKERRKVHNGEGRNPARGRRHGHALLAETPSKVCGSWDEWRPRVLVAATRRVPITCAGHSAALRGPSSPGRKFSLGFPAASTRAAG